MAIIKTIFGIGLVSIVAPAAIKFAPSHSSHLISSTAKAGCIIKGNISISNGRKLYHLPGMKDYEKTVIIPEKGEKWFCTEAEAVTNGWTKAPK